MTIEEMQNKLLSLADDKIKLNKELEVYKKALKMACTTISNSTYLHPENHIEEEYIGYLRKAKGEE